MNIYFETIINMTEIQLDIIRAFGSKQLSEGCLIQKWLIIDKAYWVWHNSIHCTLGNKFDKNDIEILWHIPELFPDFARVADEKWLSYYINTDSDFIKVIIAIWEKYPYDEKIIPYIRTLPLIDQDSQLTLLPLLNLFK